MNGHKSSIIMNTFALIQKAFRDHIIRGVFIGDLTTALALINKNDGPAFWASFDRKVIAGFLLGAKNPISSFEDFREVLIKWSLEIQFNHVFLLVLIKEKMSEIKAVLHMSEDSEQTELMQTRSLLNIEVLRIFDDATIPVASSH